LLDEILQGTNSRERHIAVGAVIRQLLENGAFGAFTTHDLDLAKDEGLRDRSSAVYFTESFEQSPQGDVMTFDYRMHPGIAPSTNALKLLKIVGLTPDQS
jgi:DNA mismatch repair ATPase MutS